MSAVLPPPCMVLKLPNTWAMFRIMYLIMGLMIPMAPMSLISPMGVPVCGLFQARALARSCDEAPAPEGWRTGHPSGILKQRDLINMSRK